MNVEVEYTGPKVRLPKPATLFGEIENEMRAKAGATRDRVVQSMRGEIPRQTGRTAATTLGRVGQIQGGYQIRVTNSERGHILMFLEQGTGNRGPRRRTIEYRKRGRIPKTKMGGSLVPSGVGQKPQGTMTKMLKAPWQSIMPKAIADMRAAWDRAVGRIGK